MHWIKMISKRHFFILFLFIAIFLITRLPRLGNDEINPDAVNWHYRSEQFIVGLKTGQFEKTYQHYHPGVILMWVIGIPIEVYKQITGIKIYNQYTFYTFHFIAKYSLVFTQLFLTIFIVFILSKIFPFKKTILILFLLSMEPFFVGNSRLLHMDIIFTLFVFSSLTLFYLYILKNNYYWLLLAALFSSLAFLTKSIGIGLFMYLFFGGFLFFSIYRKNLINKIYIPFIFISTFFISTFILFPALWKSPFYVLTNIFSEGQRIGLENGHEQIFFGEKVNDPGPLFYPITLFLKTSPLIFLGIFFYFISLVRLIFSKNKNKAILFNKDNLIGFTTFLTFFYLGYFIFMTLSSKKIDRYMLVLFPLLTVYASTGYLYICENVKNIYKKYFLIIPAVFFFIFVIQPLITIFPYYFTYTNPLLGSSYNANNIIGQKPFGIGIFDVKNKILKDYGPDTKVGFIDTKPIKSIYPNSLVHDIRVDGPSGLDAIILGINEDFPENVTKSNTKFTKDSSIFINGLEYWRFYVKQNK